MKKVVFKTDWGWAGVAATGRGVRAVVLPKPTRRAVERALKATGLIFNASSSGVGGDAATKHLKAARKAVFTYLGGKGRAFNLPLDDMADPVSMANIEENDNLYVHCAGGYRSSIACSLLKRQGIHNLRNVAGGWNAIQQLEKVEIVKEKSVLN